MSKENRVIIYDNSENTPTDLFTHEPHEIKTTFQNEYIEAIHRAYNQFYYESLITFRQLFQKKLPDQMIQEVDLRSQSNSFIKNEVTKLYDYLDTVFMNRQIGYFCGEEFKSLDKMGECFFGNFTTFLTADEKKLPYWKEFVEVTKWYKDFNLSEIKKK